MYYDWIKLLLNTTATAAAMVLGLVLPTWGNTVWIWHYSCIWHVRRHFRRLVNAQVVLAAVAVRGIPILTLRNYCALKERWKRWVELKSKVKQCIISVEIESSFLTLGTTVETSTQGPPSTFFWSFWLSWSARKKENWTSTFSWQGNAKDWLINYSFQRCIELKWKMWFAWFLVEPNILICGLKAVNKPQVYKFSSNNKNQRNCLCVHSSFYIRDIVLWAARNVLWPEHPAFIPLKDIYDDLLQDFLRKCWQLETKSLRCPKQ